MNSNDREIWADWVKGITIYLVVLGHAIQNIYYGGYDFEDNHLFSFIYGFHMPLFACVSGYFLEDFLKKYSFRQGLLRKFKTILLPCIVWAFGYYVIYVIRYRQFKSLSDFRDDILGANWFLWAIFYCSVICLIIVKFDKSLWKTSLFIIVLNFFIPDYYNLTGYKMIFPFILMGVLLKRYNLLHKFLKLKNKYQWIIIIFFVILYLAFYPWIGKEYAWEIFIHFDLGRLFMVLKRWGINFIGTVDGLLIMIKISEFLKKKINYNKNLILILGRNSLGIYMFQTFIYQYFYSKIMVNESWSIGIKCLYTFTVSLLVTIICLTCVLLVKKNRKLSVLLLGKG